MRLYNGCPDEELQRLMDDKAKAKKEIEVLGYRCVYFPAEGKYIGFKDLVDVTGFCDSVFGVLSKVKKL